jgi:hypothetical protein
MVQAGFMQTTQVVLEELVRLVQLIIPVAVAVAVEQMPPTLLALVALVQLVE